MRLGRIAVLSTIVAAVVGVVATPVVEADAITLLGFQSRDVIVQVFANESSTQKSQRVDDDGLRSAMVTGDVSAGTATALSEASQTSYVGTAALGGALAVSGVSRAAEFDRAYAVAQSLFEVQFEINDPHRFDWWVTLDVALSDSTRVVSSASLRELDPSSADILFVGLDIFGTPGGTRGETTTAHRSGLLDPGTYLLVAEASVWAEAGPFVVGTSASMGNGMTDLNLELTPVPEPGTLVLFTTGLAGALMHRRRHKRRIT